MKPQVFLTRRVPDPVLSRLEASFALSDEIALMHDGRIVQQGTPEEFRASDDPKVKEFLERDFPDATIAA